MSELARELARRYFDDFLNPCDVAVAREILAEDVTFTAGRERIEGRDAFMQHALGLHKRFPGLHFDVHDVIVEGDTAVAHITMRGRQGDVFMGVPPTNAEFAIPGVNFFRVREGRIGEVQVIANMLELLRQIGASPPGVPWKKIAD